MAKKWKGSGTTTNPTSGNWSKPSNWSSSGAPGSGADVILGGNSTYTLTVNVSATANLDSLTITDPGATLALGSATLNVTGTGGGATDRVDVQAGHITIAGGTINAGSLTLDSATASSLSGWGTVAAPLSGSGTVTANGGTLEFTNTVGASTFQIANASLSDLRFDNIVGTGATVAFNGSNGVLDLSHESSLDNFHGVVANFASGDGIEVLGAASATLDSTGTILSVYDNSATPKLVGTITFAKSYTGDKFTVSSNGTITVSPPSSPPMVTFSNVISGPANTDNATLNGYWVIPPDNALAVSPNYVLMAENNVIEITDRSGVVQLGPESAAAFFSSVDSGYSLTDPRAVVDPVSGKFIVTSDALTVNIFGIVTGSAVVYAISNTTDPVHGGWTFGRVNTTYTIGGASTWGDQPTIASNGAYLDITTAQFGVLTGQYVANAVTIVPLSGGTPNAFSLGGVDYRPVAVAGGDYFVGYTSNALSIGFIADSTHASASNSLSLGSIDVGNGAYTAPQLGSSVLLDAGFNDVASAVYANGYLYAVFEVVSPVTNQTDVHWVKAAASFNSATGILSDSLVAQGDITGPSGAVAFNPSIAVDANGDVLVNYTVSSAAMDPAAYASVMPAGSSSFLAPVQYGSSVAPETATFGVTNNVIRWGDYSSAVADPAAANAFVVSNEIVPSAQSASNNAPWGTVTATITLAPGTSGAVITSASTTSSSTSSNTAGAATSQLAPLTVADGTAHPGVGGFDATAANLDAENLAAFAPVDSRRFADMASTFPGGGHGYGGIADSLTLTIPQA